MKSANPSTFDTTASGADAPRALSEQGFDLILAAAEARQITSPTVRALRRAALAAARASSDDWRIALFTGQNAEKAPTARFWVSETKNSDRPSTDGKDAA